jgi:cytochrome P450
LPVNESESIAVPLCARAMCVLLGASAAESAHLVTSANPASTPAAMAATIARVAPGVRAMIRRRQDDPRPDVVSELLVEAAGDRRAIARLTNMLSWLPMSSNWQLPSAVLDAGFSLLLTHARQRARLAADPALLSSAVDEICRLFVSSEASRGGLTRQAATDLALGGVQIRGGDVVLVDVAAANRDEQVFADPLTFDIGRRPNPHLTFSHGPFMCRFGPTSRTLIAAGLSSGLPEMAGMMPTDPPAGISQAERRRLRDGEFEDLWLSR